jgi:hypothetical protein
MTRRAAGGWVGLVVAVQAALAAQARQQAPGATRIALGGEPWRVELAYLERRVDGDIAEMIFTRGVALRRGSSEIVAREGVIQNDVDATRALLDTKDEAVPRRGAPQPSPRRVADEAELERRLASFLAATGQQPPKRADVKAPTGREQMLSLTRSLLLEGDVTVLHDGVEVLRAQSLYVSAIDDRMVISDFELRLPSKDPTTGGMRYVTLRGQKLVRQGVRFTGRDVSITTSIAGKPHFEFVSGEVELIERGEEFEVRGRDNRLLVHGSKLSALPDLNFFTTQEPPVPLKGIAGGYGTREGVRGEVIFGGTWNGVGGALHETLTGDAAEEFRGQWRGSVGYNQARGMPLRGEANYKGGELYRGAVRGFYLDDQGRNRGPVQLDLDNSVIRDRQRDFLRTQNRVWLGEDTNLDLELFHVSDPAVFPEFHQGEYLETELPESRVHLRHGRDNWLATASGRFDINGVAYRDSRALADRFLEELPVGTFDLFSEPLMRLPGGAPLLLTSSTNAGYLRWNYDRLAVTPADEEALRLDQELELAAPFEWGALTLRPFVFGRATYYSDNPVNRDVTRWSYGGGVRVGTRLERTWRWLDGDDERALRHVITPEVAVFHRTQVSDAPSDVFQFDQVDQLDEDVTVRVGAVNRLQSRRRPADAAAGAIDQPLWLDLQQNFKPNSQRDNGGEVLGLLEYELLLAPGIDWPLPNMRFFVEGEHDYRLHDERTFNVGTQFGKVLGADWTFEYREDQVRDGVLLAGLSTSAWSRWTLATGTSYDLDRDETLNYYGMLMRNDLDWTVRIGLNYDNLNDETSFFIRFEPTLGGFVEPRAQAFARGLQAWGPTLQGY